MRLAAYLLSLFAPVLMVTPSGAAIDMRQRYFAPHKNRASVRRARKGSTDRVRMAVVNGRVTFAEHIKLVGAKGLRP